MQLSQKLFVCIILFCKKKRKKKERVCGNGNKKNTSIL